MSLLTQRAALRLQLAEIDATPCAACDHPLWLHSLVARRPGESVRYHPTCKHHTAGDFDCKCKGFVETTDEQIALNV